MGEPGDIASGVSEQTIPNDTPGADVDSDEVIAGRRMSIAATLVQLGFIAADRATPDNPAVQVLSEILPRDGEIGLCLTCHSVSSTIRYPFNKTAGVFPNVGRFRVNSSAPHGSSGGAQLLTALRREIVVCTATALRWTTSRVRNEEEDTVTLYSVPFRDTLGATVRHGHKGIVGVWVEAGPTLSFRVAPESADALQAHVDQAAQSQ